MLQLKNRYIYIYLNLAKKILKKIFHIIFESLFLKLFENHQISKLLKYVLDFLIMPPREEGINHWFFEIIATNCQPRKILSLN